LQYNILMAADIAINILLAGDIAIEYWWWQVLQSIY
jgi:hypothetical protein